MSRPKVQTPLEALKHYWGYPAFRELQEEIIESVLQGNDTLALLPTGGGKSLTFQIPALLLPGLTLVVTPLISLMKDQVDRLRQLGIRASYLRSAMTRSESNLIFDKCRYGRLDILYVSPEKLRSPSFRDTLKQLPVSLIVVDEAHCISQWGYDFRPSYLKIAELRDFFPEAPVLALTASATPEVVDDIRRSLDFRSGRSKFFSRSFARPNISFLTRYVDVFKEPMLLKILSTTHGSAIVYTRSRKRTAETAHMLCENGIDADFYHAGLDPEEKNERQNRWTSGQTRVMVATNAFGMGIDKADVRVVVHIDIPSSLEEYYQEAGRAGRDGLPAYAVIIAAKTDKARLGRMLSAAFPDKEFIRRVYELLGACYTLAEGEGEGRMFPFDLWQFAKTFHLPERETHSALNLLSRSGWIEYIDETEIPSRVMVIVEKDELYRMDFTPDEERVLTALLRSYTGLFVDYVPIEESRLAASLSVNPDLVHASLVSLGRKHALSYIPRTKSPYVQFLTPRQRTKDVLLPREVYQFQRERMEKRLKAMKEFVYENDSCRVNHLLRWFGQQALDGGCGKCDYCRSQRR